MHPPKYKSTWILHLPMWVRRNPLGMFLAILCILTGTLYALNLATSNVITEKLDPTWLRAWGAYLTLGGLVKIYGNVVYDYPAEKLGCRLISVALIVYSAWIAVLAGPRASFSIALSLALVFSLEARVAVINLILSPTNPIVGGNDPSDNNSD